jgi:hypothetical protein
MVIVERLRIIGELSNSSEIQLVKKRMNIKVFTIVFAGSPGLIIFF